MINVEHINFAYSGPADTAAEPDYLFKDFSLTLEPGRFAALLGSNGSGKSTLAKLLNGMLLPASGRVLVDELPTDRDEAAWEIRRRVGVVFQDPSRQIVGAVVEDDVAFGLENIGLPREEIVRRVDEVLKRLNIEHLRRSEPHYLSGGQKQRVAIAGVLAMRPNYLVLDEPTAMLDPRGRRSVLNLVKTLQHECGLGVVYVTHHMEEALEADRLIVLDRGAVVKDTCRPEELFADLPLLQKLGLQLPPIPYLAAALAADLRHKPAAQLCTVEELADAVAAEVSSAGPDAGGEEFAPPSVENAPAAAAISLRDVSYTYLEGTPFAGLACDDVNLDIREGEVLGIIGATGSGKSTLLQLMNGLLRCTLGTVTAYGCLIPGSGGGRALAQVRSKTGFLFQFSEQQLFETTIYEDVAFGPRNLGLGTDEIDRRVRRALQLVKIPEAMWQRSPLTISGGEKRRVALAGVLSCEPKCLLLDEPAAGLDLNGTADLLQLLRYLNSELGLTIVMISHRYEEIARVAGRLAVMKNGRLLAAASPSEILYNSELLEEAEIEGSAVSRLFQRLHALGVGLDMWPVCLQEALSCCRSLLETQ